MLFCYSFSTFTHVTCSLSVSTIFSLGWEVHPLSNILTLYSLFPVFSRFRDFIYPLWFYWPHYWVFGFLTFARHYLLNLVWFLFLLLLRYFNSQRSIIRSFLLLEILISTLFFRLFVAFYVLLVVTLSHPSNIYIYFSLNYAHKETRTLKIYLEGRRFTS